MNCVVSVASGLLYMSHIFSWCQDQSVVPGSWSDGQSPQLEVGSSLSAARFVAYPDDGCFSGGIRKHISTFAQFKESGFPEEENFSLNHLEPPVVVQVLKILEERLYLF